MTDDDSYKPIPCVLYDSYEIAIMHGAQLQLVWLDADQQHHIDVVKPIDLQTRLGAEYLLATTDEDKVLELRLDHIQSCKPVV